MIRFEWSMYAMAACPMTMLPIRHFPSWLLAAPWAFVLAEVTSMLPRAWRGHKWYHDKFGVDYPKERKVVIPGVL
jgi:3-oxo-5-alpha-steroid 4-dehydrogenase 1